MVGVGDEAPVFSLPDQEGDLIDIEQFTGAWHVLTWLRSPSSPNCTAIACGFRDQLQSFGDLGCRVIALAYDRPEDLLVFDHRHRLRFSLLSDTDHAVSIRYGVARPDAAEPDPVTLLIGPDRRVRHRFDVRDAEFHVENVLDTLEHELFTTQHTPDDHHG